MWTGDIVSKTGGGRARTADPGTRLLDYVGRLLNPLVGRQAVALYKKDMIEFSLRSPYFLLYKFLPGLIAPMIILLAMRWNLSNIVDYSYISVRDATYGAVGMVLFIMVGQGNLFAGNQFGLEDSAIKNLMLMPTPRRYYLLGKNLFLGLLFLLDALVLSILMLLYYPSAYTFFAWFSLMVTLFLLILTIGNFTSTIWPYWMPLDKPSFTLRSTVILGLVNMAATILLAILFAPALAAVYFPHEFGQDWLSYIMMLAAVAYGILIHQFTLKPAVQLLESNEFLVLRRVAEREEL